MTDQHFPSNVFDTQSRERWTTVVNYGDYPASVNGNYGPNNGASGFPSLVSANFTGLVDLVIDLFPYTGAVTACAGAISLEAFGDSNHLAVSVQGLTPGRPAILVTGTPGPMMPSGLCVGGVSRVPNSLQFVGTTGRYTQNVDTSDFLPGDSPVFQLWYSSPAGRAFSSAVQVTL